MRNIPRLAAIGGILSFHAVATAQQFEMHNFTGINQAITDGDPNGIVDARTISSSIFNVADVNVTLTISGTFNGDIFARLNHGSNFAVLLNRVGSRNVFPPGYGDDGFNGVEFDDQAPLVNGSAADVHTYRLNLTGSHSTSLGSGVPLTGTWEPDARNLDPNLETGTRTAFLNIFNGTDANGEWSLFVADQSFGETHTLVSWSLEITPVPEPSTLGVTAAAGCLIAATIHRLRRNNRNGSDK